MKDHNTIRIALVDDHSLFREGLRSLLTLNPGFQIVGECYNAMEGLAMVKAQQPDVVLTDIAMADCPFSMMRGVRDLGLPTCFIIVSAFDSDAYIEQALHAGASGFIVKTDDARVMEHAITVVANGGEYFSEYLAPRIDGARRRLQAASSDGVCGLTVRELEVLRLVAAGQSAKQIAAELKISTRTVDRHKSNIMAKLQLRSQVELTRYAIREGLASA